MESLSGNQAVGAEKLNLSMADTSAITCTKCGSHKFVSIALLRRVSPLVSPTAQEAVVPISSYACHDCGWLNQAFLPAGLTEDVENSNNSTTKEKV